MMKLTKKQLELLTLLAYGYSFKQIASIQGVSYQTVKNHMYARKKSGQTSGILERLNVLNSISAIVVAIKNDIIKLDDIEPIQRDAPISYWIKGLQKK